MLNEKKRNVNTQILETEFLFVFETSGVLIFLKETTNENKDTK